MNEILDQPNIQSLEMDDKNEEITNIVRVMDEALTLEIEKNYEKYAMKENLTQEDLNKNFKNIQSKINESKSFQDNLYTKFMEQTTLMLEQNIKISTSFTKEKIKELMENIKIEKVEHIEVIKALGLTHSLLNLILFNKGKGC